MTDIVYPRFPPPPVPAPDVHWSPLGAIVCTSKGKHAKPWPEDTQHTKYAGDVTCQKCRRTRTWRVDHERYLRIDRNKCVFCRNRSDNHFWFDGKCMP